MTTTLEAVSELPPNGAALVDYPKYKATHPIPKDPREMLTQKEGARVYVLNANEAVLIDYSAYDGFVLESTTPELPKE